MAEGLGDVKVSTGDVSTPRPTIVSVTSSAGASPNVSPVGFDTPFGQSPDVSPTLPKFSVRLPGSNPRLQFPVPTCQARWELRSRSVYVPVTRTTAPVSGVQVSSLSHATIAGGPSLIAASQTGVPSLDFFSGDSVESGPGLLGAFSRDRRSVKLSQSLSEPREGKGGKKSVAARLAESGREAMDPVDPRVQFFELQKAEAEIRAQAEARDKERQRVYALELEREKIRFEREKEQLHHDLEKERLRREAEATQIKVQREAEADRARLLEERESKGRLTRSAWRS